MHVDNAESANDFDIDGFLAREAEKDLLRFTTAGSVDDGKSTLIGRLLYDSRNVYEDHLHAIAKAIPGRDQQPILDFALLTDGLRAEREQGITIDVAYRYFSTRQRKFIIADTPGHEQYTRNMTTGASTADLAIVLIDARKGVQLQSRRHAYIASLLGIRHFVAAINKMDLVGFSEEVYRRIEGEFQQLLGLFDVASRMELASFPVSALDGDNVVKRSMRMPWYVGSTLLEHLEQVPVGREESMQPLRFPVQQVIRPDQNFRGFAGRVYAGTLRKGQRITTLPSGHTSRIASIRTFSGELEEAKTPLSVVIALEDELDISRGDLIVDPARPPQHANRIEASLVWFDREPLDTHRPYLVKHGSQLLPASIPRVVHRTNMQTLADEAASCLHMNDVGVAEIKLTRQLFFDTYAESRASGSFILIDVHSNATVAAGMIRQAISAPLQDSHKAVLLYGERTLKSLSRLDGLLERRLFHAEASIVLTPMTSVNMLRGLLVMGLFVLVDSSLEKSVVDELKADGFTLIDAQAFASHDQLFSYLRENDLLPTSSVRHAAKTMDVQ